MHLATADEMREMDRLTIESFGLPGRVLMENAGRGATRVLMNKFPDIASKRVGIIAGRGNNGGDGFVIARYLERAGVQGELGPVMNEERDAEYWFSQPGAPFPKLENEDEEPMTVSYDELIQSWQN